MSTWDAEDLDYGSNSPVDRGVLPKTEIRLSRLIIYLVKERGQEQLLRHLDLIYDPDEDEKNLKNPRFFCRVLEGDFRIYCSQALEDLRCDAVYGILVHEIGHILQGKRQRGEDGEVFADLYAETMFPGNFSYGDVKYFNRLYGREVWAKHVELLSEDAVKAIERGMLCG